MTTIRAVRLAAQRIEQRVSPARRSCPLDAGDAGQDLAGAKWSVGLRSPGTTLADVDAALADGEVIRSWPMRGTLHLVAARGHRLDAGAHGDPDCAVAGQAIPRTGPRRSNLRHARGGRGRRPGRGRRATRAEMFSPSKKPASPPRASAARTCWAGCTRTALLCLGTDAGVHQAVVLMDEWVPQPAHTRTGRGTRGVRPPVLSQPRTGDDA